MDAVAGAAEGESMSIFITGIDMPRHGMVINIYPDGRVADHFDEFQETIATAVPVPPHDDEAFEKVILERITQIAKWGDESRNHPFEWMSILGEEFGELCEAVNETCFRNGTHPERGGNENIIREAA